jgi:hypothetical protein
MKIQRTVLLAGLLAGGAPTLLALDQAAFHPGGVTPPGLPRRNLVIRPTGQMHIRLDVPTDTDVDQVTPLTSGHIEIAPLVTVPGLLGQFSLNHLSLSFADFDIDRFPFGLHRFRAVGVHLRGPVSFVAPESPAGVYAFTIPPDEITVYGAAMIDGPLGGRHDGEERPSRNVTGRIDLNTKAFEVRVVITKEKSLRGVHVGGPLIITLSGSFIYGGLEPLPPLPGR